jgi:hypothetical protein
MRFQPWRILSGGLKMPTPLHQRVFYSNSKGLNGFCQEILRFLFDTVNCLLVFTGKQAQHAERTKGTRAIPDKILRFTQDGITALRIKHIPL